MRRSRTYPEEIARGVFQLETGRGLTETNVYFVRSEVGWVLIDTAWSKQATIIRAAAESLFGKGTSPVAMGRVHPPV
jgi:alkyl sulfatase BDS1-like metallo-beta-lactamase superfamily hydrolase